MATDMPDGNYEEVYKKLHSNFIVRLEKSATAIDDILNERPPSEKSLIDMMSMSHGLAGAGTIFGFPDITHQGKIIDKFLTQAITRLTPEKTLQQEDLEKFSILISVLRTICLASVRGAETPSKTDIVLPQKRSLKSIREDFSVLIVDDDKDINEFIALKLRQGGLRVSVVGDGEAAIVMLGRSAPDLVILDISLPGMNGHQVLRQMKKNPLLSSIPVLVLTSHTEQEHIAGALHAGAVDYIVKPFETEKLVSRINKLLNDKKFTVLIADNDVLILKLLTQKFLGRGFKVIVSDDGKDAWNQIIKHLPDLVILDRMMPGLEGLSILKNMREENLTRNIPAIILSARGNPVDIENGRKTVAQDYVVKPFLPEDLIEKSLALIRRDG